MMTMTNARGGHVNVYAHQPRQRQLCRKSSARCEMDAMVRYARAVAASLGQPGGHQLPPPRRPWRRRRRREAEDSFMGEH